jgi:hypothetical protein
LIEFQAGSLDIVGNGRQRQGGAVALGEGCGRRQMGAKRRLAHAVVAAHQNVGQASRRDAFIASHLAVDDDIECSAGSLVRAARPQCQVFRNGQEGYVHPAIGMHLHDHRPVRLHSGDQHRREDPRYAGRGDQHLPEQGAGVVVVLSGENAHVPYDGLLAVQVGRGDQKPATLGMFASDGLQQFGRDVFVHQFAQGRGAEKAWIEEDREAAPTQQVAGPAAGVGAFELGVPVGPDEGERRSQGAGADAGYDIEDGSVPAFRPPHQHAGPVGAVRAAARQGEQVEGFVGREQSAHFLGKGFQPRGVVGANPRILGRDQRSVSDAQRAGWASQCAAGRHRQSHHGRQQTGCDPSHRNAPHCVRRHTAASIGLSSRDKYTAPLSAAV